MKPTLPGASLGYIFMAEKKLYAAYIDLEKAYDRVDREASSLERSENLWLLEEIKAFHREASACVRMDGKLSESFPRRLGVRQGCVMLPWLFNES